MNVLSFQKLQRWQSIANVFISEDTVANYDKGFSFRGCKCYKVCRSFSFLLFLLQIIANIFISENCCKVWQRFSFQGIQFKSMAKFFISEVANVTKYGKGFHFSCCCCKLWQIFSFQKTVAKYLSRGYSCKVWQRFM